MPAGIVGHFGPELRRFVLFQYHQGQVTVLRLVAPLPARYTLLPLLGWAVLAWGWKMVLQLRDADGWAP